MKTKNLLLYTISLFCMMSCNQIKEKLGGNSNENLISENTQLNCDYTNLSNQFNMKFVINKDPNKTIEGVDYNVQVLDKTNKVLKTITTQPKISSEELDQFKICDQVKSLSTKYNLDKQFNIESFDGNVIIGDYNFDGKDDIAIYNYKNDTKVFYDYFLQNASGEFIKDKFLSEDTDYFAKKYDVTNKMIVIQDNASIKKYAYGNNNWALKEEVNDPFPNSPKSGVICNFNRENKNKFLTLYDENFKKVGKLEYNQWENFALVSKEYIEINEFYNSDTRISSFLYKEKVGMYYKLDSKGDYYLNALELKNHNFTPESKLDYVIKYESSLITKDFVMNVRKLPTSNSELLTQLDANKEYFVSFTGNKKGSWVELSEISDNDYTIIIGKCWVKLLSDNGELNFN